MTPEKEKTFRRRAEILQILRRGPTTAHEITLEIWRDKYGPVGHPGNCHPLIRATGRMLHALKRRGTVDTFYCKLSKHWLWVIKS